MIDVARIDYWAANGSGPLHRASVSAKLVFLLLIVAAAVAARDPFPLAVGYLVLVVIAATAGLPWLTLLALSLPAAVFSVLYAISLRGGAALFAVFILKAVTPAYAAGMMIVTTPYPRIFSFLSTVLPEILASGLFMTYRTLFILMDMMDNFGASIRLRGGFTPGSIAKNGANIARGLAGLLLRAVERSSHLYAVMSVRGYAGSMAEKSVGRMKGTDWLPLGTGLVVFLLVSFWDR